jgi:hypothetical protein
MDEPKVRLASGGFVSNTHVLVGDNELRVTKAVLTIDANDGRAILELETFVDLVDVEVLEKNTLITLNKMGAGEIMESKVVTVVLDCGHTRTQRVGSDRRLHGKNDKVQCAECGKWELASSVMDKADKIAGINKAE